MRFASLWQRRVRGTLSRLEAAALLGMSARAFRRRRDRCRQEGEVGLVDRRVGKPSPGRAGQSAPARVRALYEETYGGFTVKHVHAYPDGAVALFWRPHGIAEVPAEAADGAIVTRAP